jgi:hypothetical protein
VALEPVFTHYYFFQLPFDLLKMLFTIFKQLQKKYDKKYKNISIQEEVAKAPTCPHRQQQASVTSTGAAPSTTTKDTVVNDEICTICKQEKHEATVYRWKLIGGLLLPYTLASLDLTIVASSLPFIASYFSEPLSPFLL